MESAEINLIDEDLLPPQVRQLVRVIGLPDTLRLLEVRGGLLTRIPTRADVDSALKGVLSTEALAALVRSELAGRRIEMPKDDKIRIQLRNHAVREARNHMSAAKTARMFRLTRRHVINVTNKVDDNPTGDLFDACSEPPESSD